MNNEYIQEENILMYVAARAARAGGKQKYTGRF